MLTFLAWAEAAQPGTSARFNMYGVDSHLNLLRFHGATLTQICIGEFQQQFHFVEPELHVSVEGEWRLENPAGDVVDRNLPNGQRDAFKLHRLLGRTIVDHEVSPPNSFALRFDNGWSLVVFDSSSQYESFSIQPGDTVV